MAGQWRAYSDIGRLCLCLDSLDNLDNLDNLGRGLCVDRNTS